MKNKTVKPFIKWAGGKRQILSEITKNLPSEFSSNNLNSINYFEPFLGSGAVYFHLYNEYKELLSFISLNDINIDLILCYQQIKSHNEDIIEELKLLELEYLLADNKTKEKIYLDIRKEFNDSFEESFYLLDNIIKSAYFIFLNKTCFNGLYRINKKGKFNVSFGKRFETKFDYDNIQNVSESLKIANIFSYNYLNDLNYSLIDNDKLNFFYFDPPYDKVKEDSFTQYNKTAFGKNEQKKLYEICKSLNIKSNVKFMLSNSDTEYIRELYSEFNIIQVKARRNINSNGSKRGPINELLIMNY